MKRIVIVLALILAGCSATVPTRTFEAMRRQKDQKIEMMKGEMERLEQDRASYRDKLNTKEAESKNYIKFRNWITMTWVPEFIGQVADGMRTGQRFDVKISGIVLSDDNLIGMVKVTVVTGGDENTGYAGFHKNAARGWHIHGILMDRTDIAPDDEYRGGSL